MTKQSNKNNKTWIEISKSALTNNVRAFRNHVGYDVSIMAVVKANAYGHGLIQGSVVVDQYVDWFGVDNVEEGIELRKAGIKKPILILGYTLNDRLKDCIENELSFVVYNLETANALKSLNLKSIGEGADQKSKPALVHIKIETGTSRQGVCGEELVDLANKLRSIPGVVIQGVYTHFANIEDTTDHSYAEHQLKKFKDSIIQLQKLGIDPKYKHSACSAAAVLFPETYFNMIRLGISMYGHWSSKETLAVAKQKKINIELKPVMTWKSRVVQIKEVNKGSFIGYGLTEPVTRNSKLAVIPVGYSDGYDRKLSGSGIVLINGHRCKVIGRVCMNMFIVDVTDVSDVNVEDETVLLGSQKNETISAEDMAEKIDTIQYEVLARINPKLSRIYI